MLAVEIRKVLLADLLARQDEQRTLVFGALTPEERAVGVNDDLIALGVGGLGKGLSAERFGVLASNFPGSAISSSAVTRPLIRVGASSASSVS